VAVGRHDALATSARSESISKDLWDLPVVRDRTCHGSNVRIGGRLRDFPRNNVTGVFPSRHDQRAW